MQQNMDSQGKNQLEILVASDIHMNKVNVDRLIERVAQRPIDLILLLGDFHNLPQDETYNDEQLCNKAIEEIRDLLHPFTLLNRPIYLIPGNHDPILLFQDTQLSDKLISIEKKIISIGHKLDIVAIGGSVTGFLNGEPKWEGFPYKSEQEFSVQFNQLESRINEEHQILLVTHVGPTISNTTISHEYGLDNPLQSGSSTLSEYLLRSQNQVILNLHGHTHDGVGYKYLNGIRVVNAGPLCHGSFVFITLLAHENKRWILDRVDFQMLD